MITRSLIQRAIHESVSAARSAFASDSAAVSTLVIDRKEVGLTSSINSCCCARTILRSVDKASPRRPSLNTARNRASAGAISRLRINAASTSVRADVAKRSDWQRDLIVAGRDAGRLEIKRNKL